MAAIANLLKGNSFEIEMPKTPILASVVTSVDIASSSLDEVLLPYVEIDTNVPGEKITYGKLDLTFLIDENMDSYMEIYNFMTATAGPNTIESKRREFTQDVTVSILNNNKNAVVRKFIFTDCWFTFLGNISLDNSSSENVVGITTVSFSTIKIETPIIDTTGFNKINYTTELTPPNPFV